MAAGTEPSGLEERVAALEEMAAHPLQIVSAPPHNFSDAQVAELRQQLGDTMSGPYQHRVIPSPPPLTPDEVRQLLRECVTVVKPGETLVVRVPWGTTPAQVRELQAGLVKLTIWMDVPFKVLVLPGDELGIAEPEVRFT